MAHIWPERGDDLKSLVRAALDIAGPGRAHEVALLTGSPRIGLDVPDRIAVTLRDQPGVPFTSTPLPEAPKPAQARRAAKKSAPNSRRAPRRTKE